MAWKSNVPLRKEVLDYLSEVDDNLSELRDHAELQWSFELADKLDTLLAKVRHAHGRIQKGGEL